MKKRDSKNELSILKSKFLLDIHSQYWYFVTYYFSSYVLALKEELAQAEAQKEISGADGKLGSGSLSHPEQTILSLRRIVERLRVENKNLKEARSCFDFKRDTKVIA